MVYGLREKQKVKRMYGLTENQFKRFFVMAEKAKGVTGTNLLVFLERRLDNMVYRIGFAVSRKEARQMVTHAHVTVNGKTVNIPSYLIKEGDEIAIRHKGLVVSAKCPGIRGPEGRSFLDRGGQGDDDRQDKAFAGKGRHHGAYQRAADRRVLLSIVLSLYKEDTCICSKRIGRNSLSQRRLI